MMTQQEKATIRFAYFSFSVLTLLLVVCIFTNHTAEILWVTTSISLVLSWFFSRSLRSNKPNPEPPPGGSVTVSGGPQKTENEQ